MRALLTLICGCLLALQTLAAQPVTVDAVRYRNFGIASGLSQVTCRAILQDEQGFVWIGTQDGLNRFDGYNFKLYYRDRQNPASLGDSHVTALANAGAGALWVGTVAGGLSRLDTATDAIKVYRHQPGDSRSLAADGVTTLLRDVDGLLWVATADGSLQTLAPGAEHFERRAPAAEALGVIRAMVQRADGLIVLGGSRGLWHYGPDGFVRVAAHAASLGDIQALAADPDGAMWVGTTRQGLLHLDASGNVQTHYRADGREGALPDDQIRSLLRTRSGELWIGTMNGLALYNAAEQRFLTWKYDAGDAGSPAGSRIAALYEDREGLIWIGSWTGGFSIHNPATRAVRLIRAHGRDRTSLPASPVRALWRDGDNSLWMGVLEGGGLVHYDLQAGVLQRWVHDPADPASLGSNVVQAIARTGDGALWVGTQGAGLSRMRADGSGFDHFRRREDEPGALPDNVIQVLYVDRQGQLWIGMESGGLARWSGGERGFEVYRHDPGDPQSLGGNSVYSIAETSDGEFWVGTFGAGLERMDRQRGRFEHFREVQGQLDSIGHNSISMIVETADHSLWIGTQGGGLNRMLRGSDGSVRFHAIGKRDGLGADAIGVLVEDRTGKLWIGTTVGVNAFNPQSGDVQAFSASDGMDRSGYFIGSVARGADGEIYFGGLRGVLAFHPERLPRRTQMPAVRYTELRFDNQPVDLRSVDPASPLQSALHATDEITVPYGVSGIAVDFSALDFANPDGVRYSYRLDGFDRDWISGARLARTAAYTNLSPGTYQLRTRARDGEGGDFGPESRLSIVVLPPWWRTPWALAVYTLILIALLWLGWQQTRRRWDREHAVAENIRRSEERLKLALWGSRDELWDLDLRSGRMQRENQLPILGAQPTVQFESREAFLRQVHPDDQPEVLAALNRHIQGQSDFYENTYRMRALDGNWCWVLSRGFAVERGVDGRALRMVGTSRDVSASAEAADALRRLNDELEHRVEERTRALRLSNRELQFTLEELKMMQKQLVESEKMAALGGLVAGIAHEINTPLGIGVTAASHLEDETRRLMQTFTEGRVTRSIMESYQADALQSSQLILSNLRRAGQLIKSFKQVAVDQSSEQAREVHLKSYLEEILVSLGPALKKTRHAVHIKCPDDLRLYTFPGAISQIVVNLVMNSLIHAFEGIEQGHIQIQCEGYDEEWLLLYRDDGVGMSDDVRQRVFDPFFTTKRGQGGSGLGLHVVYNLVTQLLRGSLDCVSTPGQGVEFQIQMPRRVVS